MDQGLGKARAPEEQVVERQVIEEVSQAKARLGVSVFALIYMGGWSLASGSIPSTGFGVVGTYLVFSFGWLQWVIRRPKPIPWRRIVVIFGDLGITSFFLFELGAIGTFIYPMYLWIIVGNGMRFGSRYLTLAMVVGVGLFIPVLWFTPYWQVNQVAGLGLLASLVVLPLFYWALLRRLHAANRRLAEEAERSQAAARAKTEFLANMSHELRTPMSGIIGITELLRLTPLRDDQSEHLDLIQRSAQSLLSLIADLLDFARIESGKLELAHEPFSLQEAVDDVLGLLRPRAEKKKLELSLTFDPELPGNFLGDTNRLRQVLFNLVGNAIKFTSSGEVAVAVGLGETLPDGRCEVVLEIRDTGIGIPEHKLESIFEKFEQVEARRARQFGGAGLGLSISRHLAWAMDGDISVASVAGQGTTFVARVVLEPAKADKIVEDWRRSFDDQAVFPGKLALVVDDDAVNRVVTCQYLKILEIETAVAEDGEKALESIAQREFDVVFMDVQLPILSGLEATRRIRAAETPGARLPIVALTANVSLEDSAACIDSGMDLTIHKPMRLADLRMVLETLQRQARF